MKRVLIVVLFFFALSTKMQAQDIQGVLDKVYKTSETNPQEKIYLHLDKYSYTAGETIWLKAYATIGIHNLFSKWSSIGYIELIDPSEKVLQSIKIPLVNGVGLGDITLIDTLTEGSYRIRAYTNWMRNYDEKYFYDRTIQISNGRADNVQTASSMSRTEKEDIYTVSLKSLSGVPLGKTSVRYELIKEGEVVSRKRTNTDDNGVLKIEVDRKHEGALIKLRFQNLEKLGVNKIIKPQVPVSTHSVQLFAEGGKLLAGHINNVAIKAVNAQGLGVKAKVYLTAGTDTLSVIQTNALGMGASFVFVNDTDLSIRAQAVFEDGSQMDVPMPEIVTAGYSLVVNGQGKDRIICQVNLSQQYQNKQDLYFVVHHIGQVYYVAKQKAEKGEAVFAVKKSDLPAGVLTISVLNSQFQPVVERAVFNYSATHMLPMAVTVDKKQYKTRDSVRVAIQVGNDSDSLRIAALSASVVNLPKIKEDPKSEVNILNALLLSADLKGFIEKPGHYLRDGHVDIAGLDYLMLTQGWRNIEWDSIGIEANPKFEAEKGIKVSGYTKKFGRKAAEPQARVQLISTQNFMDYLDTVSNEDGYFEFENIMFPDSVKFLVSAKTEKGKNNIDIVVESKEHPKIGENKNAPLVRNDVNSLSLDQINQTKQFFSQMEQKGLMEKTIVIEEVVVRASTRKSAPDYSTNLNGPGNADQVITAEDLSTCTTLEMCLAGRLMGVMWQGGVPYNTRGNVPMQVVMDGMFIDPEQVSMINIFDVESIEVLRNINYTAIYGSNGGNGLLVITSKRGSSAMNSYTPKGILTIQPKGISPVRTFYKPVYDVADAVKLNRDLRTTIHWEPGIISYQDGKATFNFFTSDEVGKYLIVLEGIDLQGRIGQKLVEVEVK